jgi:hypothetical protein
MLLHFYISTAIKETMKILLTVYSRNVNNTLSLSPVFQLDESIRWILLISTGEELICE